MIEAVVFDIGGVLEVIPLDEDPASWYAGLIARWDERMSWESGTTGARFAALRERQRLEGKAPVAGGIAYDLWRGHTRVAMGWDDATVDAFVADYWETMNGKRHPELAPYFISLMGGAVELFPEWNDSSSRYPAMHARWDKRMGWEPGTTAAKLSVMSDRHSEAGQNSMLGTITYEDWVSDMQVALGWDDATHAIFMQDAWDIYLGAANQEMIAYVASLRPRYQTALLSNSGVGAREQEQATFGLDDIVDLIVYSHEVGLLKPDPRIYALTCERLDVQPDEMIFVDNVPAMVAAAHKMGIHAVLFQNNAQVIRDIEALLAAHA